MALHEAIEFEFGSHNFDLMQQEIQNPATAVLVDVYTAWCGPCKKAARDFENNGLEAFLEFPDIPDSPPVRFFKLDLEVHQSFGNQYGIKAIPWFLFFAPSGEMIQHIRGYGGYKKFCQQLEAIMRAILEGG